MVKWTISLTDVNVAEDIFSKDESHLRGKIVQSKSHEVKSMYINSPWYLIYKYKLVTMSADFMFINGILLFVTISHHIKFIADLINRDQHIKLVIAPIRQVKDNYANCGFRIE